MLHWITSYVGRKDLNCWGLLRTIYRERFQIHLPEIAGISLAPVSTICHVLSHQITERNWKEVRTPFEGCAVAMSQSSALHHVGIYLAVEEGKIAHTWGTKSVVIVDTIRGLRLKGFRTIQFYQFYLWPTS